MRTLTDIEKKEQWLKHCKNCLGRYYCRYENVEMCKTLDNPDIRSKPEMKFKEVG
jgi:hypothetical protein